MPGVDFLSLFPDQPIRFQEKNPKRKESASYSRYESYKAARTVVEFFEISKTLGNHATTDFRYDLAKGFVKYKDSGVSKAKDRPEGKKPEKAAQPPKRAHEASSEQEKAPAAVLATVSGHASSASLASPPEEVSLESAAAKTVEPEARAKGAAPSVATTAQRAAEPTMDDSLFSLVARQWSQERGPEQKSKPSKPEMSKAVPGQSHARTLPNQRGQKRKIPQAQLTETRELVRDLVPDYVEGQPDPIVSDETLQKKASFVSESEPLVPQNRKKYAWVVLQEDGFFSHDPKMAGPICFEGEQSSLRCAMCGLRCSPERMFRVRCYDRRARADPPEWNRPRAMLAESYHVGARCMEVLVGTPPISTRRVQQLRERLHQALEARDFELENWAAVLRRLEHDQLQPFVVLLGGELRRLSRTRASDEQADAFHTRTNLSELLSFEARERHRQWRLDKLVPQGLHVF